MNAKNLTLSMAATAALFTLACSSAPPPPPDSDSAGKGSVVAPTPTTATPPLTIPGNAPPSTSPPPGMSPPPVPPSTPPGTPSGACSLDTGNPSCDACVAQACCAQILACDSNADCVALDTCFEQCAIYGQSYQAEQCEDACYAQHPQGAQILDSIYQCMDTTCAAQCPW